MELQGREAPMSQMGRLRPGGRKLRSSHREFLEEMGLELCLLSSGQGFPCYCHLPSCAANLLVEMSGCEVLFQEKRKGWRTAAYIPLQVRILEALGSLAAEKLV